MLVDRVSIDLSSLSNPIPIDSLGLLREISNSRCVQSWMIVSCLQLVIYSIELFISINLYCFCFLQLIHFESLLRKMLLIWPLCKHSIRLCTHSVLIMYNLSIPLILNLLWNRWLYIPLEIRLVRTLISLCLLELNLLRQLFKILIFMLILIFKRKLRLCLKLVNRLILKMVLNDEFFVFKSLPCLYFLIHFDRRQWLCFGGQNIVWLDSSHGSSLLQFSDFILLLLLNSVLGLIVVLAVIISLGLGLLIKLFRMFEKNCFCLRNAFV